MSRGAGRPPGAVVLIATTVLLYGIWEFRVEIPARCEDRTASALEA